jgi:hypothetical protein
VVDVTVIPPPTITIAALPASIIENQLSTINWSTTNASTCSQLGAWSGSAPTSGSLTVGPTPGTYTYTLSCTGPDGTATASATLTVIPLPQITLTFSPASIPVDTTATLMWTSLYTTSCVASDSWSGTEPTIGSQTIGPYPAGLYLFQLTCSGPGGSTSDEQGIHVFVLPTATIAISPTSVLSGTPISITWSSTNANACQTSGAWSGILFPSSGTESVASAAPGAYTYGITCTGPYGGTVSESAEVTVYGQPTATFTAGESTMTAGASTTLTWTSLQTTSCTASGAWTGGLAVSGSRTVTPTAPGTYSYDLTCESPVASVQKSVTLTVTAPPSGGGGGGAVGMLELSALGLLALLRLRRPDRGNSSKKIARLVPGIVGSDRRMKNYG